MLVFICTQYAPSCSDDKKMHWHLGDPLPASLPWEPNSEALASLTGAQWNPCVHAYFGCISMFLIFSLETVSHTHGASVWSVILSPAIASVSLLPGGGAGSMTQLREMIQNVVVKWRFKRVSVCSSYAGYRLWLPSPGTMERVWTLGSQNRDSEWA